MVKFFCGPVVLAVLLVASTAWADISPPECTVEEHSFGSQICESCETSAEDPDACEDRFAGTSFDFECTTGDGSAWTEVWCRDGSEPEPCSAQDISADGRTCEDCEASYQVPEICSQHYADTDYTLACTTGGAIFWTEVWCTYSVIEPATDAGSDTGGCHGAAKGVPMQAWLAFFPVLALIILRVRRHFLVRG